MISNCLVLAVVTATLSGFVLYMYMSASHPTIGVSDIAMRGSCSVTSRREQIVNTCRKETIVKPKYLDTIITDDRQRVLYCVIPKVTPTTLLAVNAFTTNTSWTQAVRFESLMLVFCMKPVNCLLIAALLDRC